MVKELFRAHRNQVPIVSEEEIEKLERYFAILKSWNERMALVSKKTIDLSFGNHFVDSLYISDLGKKYLAGKKAYDLGSGAGFPGLVFAIRNPEITVRLYEKLSKKQSFLSAVVNQLELKNVEIHGAMPEEKHEGLVFARAVMPPDELFPFLAKRLKNKAVLIVNIGSQAEPPKTPSAFKLIEEIRYSLPLNCGDRRAIAYQFVPRETV
jgi:16S rRNA (guanine527-N7)-methyltransferase